MAENLPFTDLIDSVACIYLETGTWVGTSLGQAACLPFKLLFSIEIDKDRFIEAKLGFKHDTRIKLLFGDSGIRIEDALKEIKSDWPGCLATIFLDSHYSGQSTSSNGKVASPIEDELKMLVKYKDCVRQVFIDDILAAIEADAGTPIPPESQQYRTGWIGLSQIKQYLAEINPKFNVHVDMARRVYGLLYTTLD